MAFSASRGSAPFPQRRLLNRTSYERGLPPATPTPATPSSSSTNPSMAAREKKQASAGAAVLVAADAKKKSAPVWLARHAGWVHEAPLSETQRTWALAQGFKGAARRHLLLPGPDGALAGAVLGLGEARPGDPMDKPALAVGLLPTVLPPGCYHLADDLAEPELAAVAWGLGAYRFKRYKSGAGGDDVARLKAPRGIDHASALA